MPEMGRPVVLGLTVLLVATLSTSCTSDNDEPETADGTTSTTAASDDTTTSTTAPVDDVEAEILAAVEGYWATIQAANAAPDPDNVEVALVATGGALEQARSNLRERRDRGQAARLPEPSSYRHHPVVASVDGDTAIVTDCSVDDTILYEVDTGVVVNDEVATLQWRTTVVRTDGGWKVADNSLEMEWEGVAGCALE